MEFQSAPIKGVLERELLPSAGRESSKLRRVRVQGSNKSISCFKPLGCKMRASAIKVMTERKFTSPHSNLDKGGETEE
jgi:hypothetical protein